ncbi:MAG: hypothetical protein ACLQM6_13520 [Acidobacteriaceae bacterium]
MVLFIFAPSQAQTQLVQPSQQQPMEVPALLLPDAPEPRDSGFAAAPNKGQGAAFLLAQSSSSSSQQASLGAGSAPPAATTPGSADTKQQQHDKAERELKQEEQQRLLGVVPNFSVVLNGQALPLTGKQKWNLALHGVVDPFYFVWSFVYGGGESELSGSNSGYGWGAAGYFKRVGANYADNVNGALIGNALLPQLLHQDPRYFRMGTGPVKSRIWNAALSTVVCRGDNGKKQFNISNVLGNYISGAISNAYYPADQRGFGQTMETGTEVTLFGALGGQMYEFAPDIIRIIFKKKPAGTPSATGATTPATPPATPAAADNVHP